MSELVAMEALVFRLIGTAPLVLHNPRLSDPLDEYTKAIKAISGKRKKTENDYEEMARLEFMGGLYLNGDKTVVIRGRMIYACLAGRGGAARKQKEGTVAATGLFVGDHFPLIYEGPKSPAELWKNASFRLRVNARVGTATVMRTRPIFEQWSLEPTVNYSPEIVNRDQVVQWMEIAGAQVGIGDWRPQYGRFSVEVLSG